MKWVSITNDMTYKKVHLTIPRIEDKTILLHRVKKKFDHKPNVQRKNTIGKGEADKNFETRGDEVTTDAL